jgi:hypothetical protein
VSMFSAKKRVHLSRGPYALVSLTQK